MATACFCLNPHYPCSACGWGSGSQTIPNWDQPVTTPNSAPQWSSPLPDISRAIREDELDCARSLILLAERLEEKHIQAGRPLYEDRIARVRALANDLFAGTAL